MNQNTKELSSSFSWNVKVEKLALSEEAIGQIRQGLCKVAERLRNYPPNAVHVLIKLRKPAPGESAIHAQLALRIPAYVLSSEADSSDALDAFSWARDQLLERIDSERATRRKGTGAPSRCRWRQTSR